VVMFHSDSPGTRKQVVVGMRGMSGSQAQKFFPVAPSLSTSSSEACSVLLKGLKKAKLRTLCLSSQMRPPGGSGAHSQASCRCRTRNAGRSFWVRGNDQVSLVWKPSSMFCTNFYVHLENAQLIASSSFCSGSSPLCHWHAEPREV
jgi:hypothetical protein